MATKRKVLAAVAIAALTLGGGVAVASAGSGSDEPPPPMDRMAELPAEVPIVDENGALVRNPDGSLKMHSTELPPLETPTGPDVTYADPPGVQQFTEEAPLVADSVD